MVIMNLHSVAGCCVCVQPSQLMYINLIWNHGAPDHYSPFTQCNHPKLCSTATSLLMRYKSLTPFMKKSCVWSLHQSSASFLKGFFLGVLKVQSYIHAHQFLVLHKNVYAGGTLGFSFCTHLLHRSITAHKSNIMCGSPQFTQHLSF